MYRSPFLFLFLVSIVSAKLPDPALTLLGGLFQDVEVGATREIQSIIPTATDHFQIVAFREGAGIVAKANIDSVRGDNLVLLRVPRDDGTGVRAEEYFSRAGEVVRFEVWYWNSPGDVESEEPDRKFLSIEEGQYTLQSGFGGVIPRSFTITIPSGETPFSNISAGGTFEDWIRVYYTGDDVNPDADWDGDGLTNYQEWILGLDPTISDGFEFPAPVLRSESDPDTNIADLKMKPTLVGRTYHIYRLSADMVTPEGAEPIHSYTPEVDSKDTWYEYTDVHDDEGSAFWKVIIEINN